MRNQTIKRSLILLFTCLLTACNGFFETDNTPNPQPLVHFTPTIKPTRLWSTHVGSGTGDDYLRMGPSLSQQAIFAANAKGSVTSLNKLTGHKNWQVNTGLPLSTTPAVGDGIMVVASRRGDVVALDQANGSERWRVSLPGEILAKPAIGNGTVVIKIVDGDVRALSVRDGREQWSSKQVEPNLILRGASAPLIRDHVVIMGFANGNLGKFSLRDGEPLWMQPVAVAQGAFAIQRMIDVDADPVLYDHRLYAATYQGQIAAMDWTSGNILWSHALSSYTGMVADNQTVFITDVEGRVFAFDANSGNTRWQKRDMEARVLTGPAAIGRYIVIGDAEGYVHWLNKENGHFAARERVGAMTAAPIVDGNIVYVLNNSGSLTAYQLS